MGAVGFCIRLLNRIESIVAVAGLALVAAVLLADVAGRELFGGGIFWAPRLASYAATVAGMLAFSVVVSAGGHLRPKAIDALIPTSRDRQANRLADFVSAGICAFLAWQGGLFVYSSYLIGQRGMSIDMPVWPVQAIIPYVFASACLRYLSYCAFPDLRPRERGIGE